MSDIYVFNINWRRFELYMFNFYEMIRQLSPRIAAFWVYDLFVNLKGHNILSYFPGQKIKTTNKFLEMTNHTWAVAAASY